MRPRPIRFYLLLLLALLATGCEQRVDTQESEATPTPSVKDTRATTATFWQTGDDTLAVIVQEAQLLQQETQAFLQSPSPDQLTLVREQWQKVQASWHRFYFFSQMGISQPVVFGELAERSFVIAANPIQPGYLDYFGPYPYSGLVHDISVSLTPETLLNQHGMTDPEDVALGIYAIEFMIKGEQLSRPASDYLAVTELTAAQQEQGFRQVSETPNYRRREILRLQTDVLVLSLKDLQRLWQATDTTSLRENWQALDADQQFASVTKNLERTLTQLLLDIVAATPPEPGEVSEPRYDSSSSPAALRNRIASLEAAVPWLPGEQGPALQGCLSQANALLASSVSRENWGAVYQQLKACLPPPVSTTP